MKLEQMKKSFLEMTDIERQEFFSNYAEQRKRDIDSIVVKLTPKKKTATKKKDKKIAVSQDQLDLLKKLGLA